jgi:hypothetical protein
MKKRPTTLLLLAQLFCAAMFAQPTPSIPLEKAVKAYNDLGEYSRSIRADSITNDQLVYLKKESEKGVAALDEVLRTEPESVHATARYFKVNFRFKYAFYRDIKAGKKADLRDLEAISAEFDAYNESAFPFRYIFEGKNFIIQYKDFVQTRLDCWMLLAEIAKLLGRQDVALASSRKVLATPEASPYFKSVNAGFILDIKENQKTKDKEAFDLARGLLRDYHGMEAPQMEFMAKNKYFGPAKAWALLKELTPIHAGNPYAQGEVYAEAAANLVKLRENALAAEAYQKAVQTGYSGTAFLIETADFAISTKNNMLGLLATSRMEQTTGEAQCDMMQKTSAYYRTFGNNNKADELQRRSEKCLKKQAKMSRSAGSDFHLYLGGYVFPAFRKNYGGVVNFAFSKTVIEFSYLNIRKKTENHMDLTTFDEVELDDDEERVWSGFYAHFAPKFVARNNHNDRNKLYTGFLLGYAQKDFKPISSNVTRVSDGAVTYETFQPTGKQYIAMLNLGGIILGRGLGMDLYASVGAAYNQFDGGHASYNSDAFTIESAFLENRKTGYFTVAMRAGITVGLCLGR